MRPTSERESPLVISYLALRESVGAVGLALPFALYFGASCIFDTGLQNSMSLYYYTGMRDVLVGALCAIGVFLLCYKGYQRQDDIAADLAGAFAIGVALFPTTPPIDPSPLAKIIGAVHTGFASLFFATLTYFAFLFTKTNSPHPTPQKLQRNVIYRACGYIMAACLVLLLIKAVLPKELQESLDKQYHPEFWLESTAVIAFGISWLTKGGAILSDPS